MNRAMIALGLVVAFLGFGAAERASAGVLGTNFTVANCADPDVASAMADPDYFVAAPDGACKALCKRAAGECKQFAKGAIACIVGVGKNELRYSLTNCELISAPAELKTCKAQAAQNFKSFKESTLGDLPGALNDCVVWGTDCQTACTQPE